MKLYNDPVILLCLVAGACIASILFYVVVFK